MNTQFDYIIIGAGISGASAAYELANAGSTLLLEAESTPGYHSTGRSAALYTANYGGDTVCRLHTCAHEFLHSPPGEFCQSQLLHERGAISVATKSHAHLVSELIEASGAISPVHRIEIDDAIQRCPLLRPELIEAAAFEPGVCDMDVALLHQCYLKGFKRRGGELVCNAEVMTLEQSSGIWCVSTADAQFNAAIVINSAGAWADEVAQLAGAKPVGLQPKRRTAVLVKTPPSLEGKHLPVVDFLHADGYIKPQGSQLLLSPGDTTPMDAHDVQPDELDVAQLVDWIETTTSLNIERIDHQWAGLRTFVSDDVPVLGFDSSVKGFFWLAGQGGFGIMMSHPLGRATRSLIVDGALPDDLQRAGVEEGALSPQRYQALAYA